jgi:hypothetical protein
VSDSTTGRAIRDGSIYDSVTPEDMSRVTDGDWREIRTKARKYCRTADAARSRKQMDGSATVVRNGAAPYGTDDVSDDVTQDAVLIFARRLSEIMAECAPASVCIATREPASWLYVRRDGEMITVDRDRLHYWAVRDAARRNGCRVDVKPDETEATPGAQLMRGLPHADHVPPATAAAYVAGHSREIFRSAWADGSDYPTLGRILRYASQADDLGRAGVLAKAAQATYGGPRNSSSKVRRTRDAARSEWRALSARLDEVRDELIHHAARARETV